MKDMARLPPATIERARHLRRDQSDGEKLLWARLRNRRFAGFKFRRQVPIGPFVVDFLCKSKGLIVELDGVQHSHPEQKRFDAERTQALEAAGFRVLRIWAGDLMREGEGVEWTIWNALQHPFSPPGRRWPEGPDEGRR